MTYPSRTAVAILGAASTVFALIACTPAALSQEEIVPAFIAASQNETRTMHMEWQGTVSMSGGGLPDLDPSSLNQTISATFDFNGADYAGTLSSGSQGGASSISYARVGGVTFQNYGDSGWQRGDSFGGQAAPEFDPLHNLAAGDVAYEALDNLDGRQVHRLRVLDPLAAISGGLFAQVGSFGTELRLNGPSEYVIFVDANGIPVGAQMVLDLAIQMNAPDMPSPGINYEMHFDYQFSLWGEPVTISPPQVTGGGLDDFPPPGVR